MIALSVRVDDPYFNDDDVVRLLLALIELTATHRRKRIAGYLADLK